MHQASNILCDKFENRKRFTWPHAIESLLLTADRWQRNVTHKGKRSTSCFLTMTASTLHELTHTHTNAKHMRNTFANLHSHLHISHTHATQHTPPQRHNSGSFTHTHSMSHFAVQKKTESTKEPHAYTGSSRTQNHLISVDDDDEQNRSRSPLKSYTHTLIHQPRIHTRTRDSHCNTPRTYSHIHTHTKRDGLVDDNDETTNRATFTLCFLFFCHFFMCRIDYFVAVVRKLPQ